MENRSGVDVDFAWMLQGTERWRVRNNLHCLTWVVGRMEKVVIRRRSSKVPGSRILHSKEQVRGDAEQDKDEVVAVLMTMEEAEEGRAEVAVEGEEEGEIIRSGPQIL